MRRYICPEIISFCAFNSRGSRQVFVATKKNHREEAEISHRNSAVLLVRARCPSIYTCNETIKLETRAAISRGPCSQWGFEADHFLNHLALKETHERPGSYKRTVSRRYLGAWLSRHSPMTAPPPHALQDPNT